MRAARLATPLWAAVVCGIVAAGCGADPSAEAVPAPGSVPAPTTSAPPTTSATTTSSTTSSTTTTTTTSTSTSTTTTTTTTLGPLPDPSLRNLNRTIDLLAVSNPAVSVTVRRDGQVVLARATGTTIDGAPATSDSPMAVASVGKLLTATLLARLDQAGRVDLDAPVPWSLLGLTPEPTWNTVTPRELLNHTSGMPVVRRQWFERSGDCRSFLPTILGAPPAEHRGRWTYSNGNYCALGLLAEVATGLPLDAAVQQVLLDPLGASGVHLTTGGQRPGDVAYPLGVDRLGRLGGAGSYLVSTDDVAAVLDTVTAADRVSLAWPGVMVDQYGWGHTGSVDGATSCAWVLEGGRTVLVVTVSGSRPGTGGEVCDGAVPALATDLGIGAGEPERSPP